MRKTCFVFLWLLLQSCGEEEVQNNKDLEQNMMDLYLENLGEQIRVKNLSDASWILDGVDSIMLCLTKDLKRITK